MPRNTIDISHVIKLPKSPEKTELQQEMDRFSEMLEKCLKARESGLPVSDAEYSYSYSKAEVEKKLKNCVTNGIEKMKSVEKLSEKQRKKRGKVSFSYFKFISLSLK